MRGNQQMANITIIFLFCLLFIIESHSNNCWITRSHAQTRDDIFIPECTRDGFFAVTFFLILTLLAEILAILFAISLNSNPTFLLILSQKSVQCHKTSGYCWCVDVITGRPKSQTTTRNRSPNCDAGNRRISSRDHNRQQKRKDRQKRFCNSSQRILFNTQLLSVFVSENNRQNRRNETSIPSSIDHKFRQMDTNVDNRVSKLESRDLIVLTKKLFPAFRACAQQLFQFCDTNNDSFISHQEFKDCLNLDLSLRAFLSLNSSSPLNPNAAANELMEQKNSFHSLNNLNGLSESSANAMNESRLDCHVTRNNAVESAKVNPHGEIFIPECTKDGYYNKIQCHKSYCWCVSRVSGQTIKTLPNNSNNSVNCESMRKGCDQRRRSKFHLKLRQLLARDNYSCDTIFTNIDANHNLYLENSEWKQFRQSWRKNTLINARLRKCFRTEMNYCDQNYDRKVSHNEWISCCETDSQHSSQPHEYREETTNRRKLGPNPFSTILISE